MVAETSEEKGEIRYIRGLELICSDTEHARNYYHYAADSKGEHSSGDKENHDYAKNKVESLKSGGKYHYYVTDEHGSVSYILNEKADVENEYVYDAFGNIITSKENVHNIFTYCGEQLDVTTGQYYLRARFYNPVIGRFTQQDTYHGDGLNLYAYCHNNPMMYCDPTGHDSSSAADKKQLPMVIPQLETQLPALRNHNNPLTGQQNSQAGNAAGDFGSRTGKEEEIENRLKPKKKWSIRQSLS